MVIKSLANCDYFFERNSHELLTHKAKCSSNRILYVYGFEFIYDLIYTLSMQTERTETFSDWLKSLDPQARSRVLDRIIRISSGNLGDHKSVGKGVSELRINFGPGYRVYYTVRKDGTIVILLVAAQRSGKERISLPLNLSRLV
jgi:putative addiction module killer protein